MSTIVVTTLLQASVLAAGDRAYEEAVQRSVESGRPLVVLLGADWCGACKVMQHSTLPKVAKAGALDDVEFTYVDIDRHPDLTKLIARGRTIPQLIRFEKKAGKWNAKHLIGGHSVQKVAAFISGEPEKVKPPAVLPVSFSSWKRLFSRE